MAMSLLLLLHFLNLPYGSLVLVLVDFDDAIFIALIPIAMLLLMVLQEKLPKLFLIDLDHIVIVFLLAFTVHLVLVHELLAVEFLLFIVFLLLP